MVKRLREMTNEGSYDAAFAWETVPSLSGLVERIVADRDWKIGAAELDGLLWESRPNWRPGGGCAI